MSSRPAPPSRRYDATSQPSVKNVFEREPLLIPQRPEDRPRPWFRRPAAWVWILIAVAVGVVVTAFGESIARALPAVIGR
jgi:hypothetical protein